MSYKQTTGSRAQVMHGSAKKTSGGLTKNQLKYNKQGKIVSRKASALAKKNNRLVKAGYKTKKGIFGISMKGGVNNDDSKVRPRNNGNNGNNIKPPKKLKINLDVINSTPTTTPINEQSIIAETQEKVNKVLELKRSPTGSIDVSGYNRPDDPIYSTQMKKITSNTSNNNKPITYKSNIFVSLNKNMNRVVIKRIKRKNKMGDVNIGGVTNELRTLIIAWGFRIPNICCIQSFRIEDISSEYIMSIIMLRYNSDLFSIISNPEFVKKIDVKYIIKHIIAILSGIIGLHNAGIAHCDIKAENIFVNNKSWYVGDFDSSIFMNDGDINSRIPITPDYCPYDLLNESGFFKERSNPTFIDTFNKRKSEYYKSIDMYSVGVLIKNIFEQCGFEKAPLIDVIIESLMSDHITRGKFTTTMSSQEGLPACKVILGDILESL
jgi:hypothetical protein